MNAAFSTPVWLPPDGAASLHEPLKPNEQVDLAIVGGGIMGLSAALHAARAGISVRVVDAKSVGEGASGLNGGQVIPGLKYDPEWLLEHFGAERGDALISFAASTADAVFDLIATEKLAVPFVRNGWIQAAHTEAALRAAENRDRQWRARGADVRLLDASEIAQKTGARGYLGGWLDRRAGVINPLAYTLELARIAKAAGVRIAEREQAAALRREAGGWRIVDRVRRGAARQIGRRGDQRLFRRTDPRPGANHRAAALLPDRDGAVASRSCRENSSRRPGGLRFPAHPRLLPQEPRRPAGAGRARTHGAAEKRGRLGASAARDAAAVSSSCRRGDRAALVRPRCHDARPSAAHPRAGAGSGHRRRLPGARRRPDDRTWRAPCRIRGEWRCGAPALPRFRRSGRSRSTPSARSALPRRSPGTACSTRWSAEPARRCNTESA